MAQIKKFQNGGKYGKYIKDGVEYTVDDAFLNRMDHYSKQVADALRNGETISYDSATNTARGNINWSNSLNERQQKRIETKGGAFEGRKMRQARQSISNLAKFNPDNNPQTDPGTKLVMNKRIGLSYLGEGDNQRIDTNAKYDSAIRRINEILNIDNWQYNDHDLSGTGLSNKEAVSEFVKSRRDQIVNLERKIKTNTLDDADKSILKDLGIDLGGSNEEDDTDDSVIATTKKKYSDAGLNYDSHKNIFNVDDDGKITISDSNLKSILGEGNAWINQSFRNRYSSWANILPDDYFIIDGVVYKADDEDLKRNAKYIEFVDDNKASRGSSDLIRQFWNNDSVYSRLGGEDIYSPANGLYGKDITGDYVRNHGVSNQPFVLEMVDETGEYDEYGRPTKSTKWFIDPYTKQRIDLKNIPEKYKAFITSVLDGTAQRASKAESDKYYSGAYNSTPYGQAYTIGDRRYGIISAYGDPYSNAFAGLYYDPNSQSYMWRDTTITGEDYIDRLDQEDMQGYYWALPTEIGELITNNPSKIDDEQFRKSLTNLLRNQYLRNINFKDEDIYDKDLLALMPALQKWLQNRNINNYTATELAHRGIAHRVPSEQNGGIIKAQKGARIEATNKASTQKFQQFDTKQREAGKEKAISDKTNMSKADWAEVGALVADAASLVSTFIPVYGNAVGAATGAASSLTQFGVDVAKDGFDWGDVGMLGANLGLDVATLLPGLGTGAKAAKVVKALKNSEPAVKLLGKVASAAGVGSALYTAYDNIFNGDEWTISDLRILVNGVRGVNNLRTLTNPTKKGEIKDDSTITIKSTDKDIADDVLLTKKEYDQILSKPTHQQKDELRSILSSKNTKTLTDDQAIQIAKTRLGLKDKEWNEQAQALAEKLKNKNADPLELFNVPFKATRPEGKWWNPATWQFWKKGGIGELKFTPEDVLKTSWWSRPARWNYAISSRNMNQKTFTPIHSNIWYVPIQDDGTAPVLPKQNVVFYKKGGILKGFGGLTTPQFNLNSYVNPFGKPKSSWDIMLEKQMDDITNSRYTTTELKEDFDRISRGETPELQTSIFTSRTPITNPIKGAAQELGINTDNWTNGPADQTSVGDAKPFILSGLKDIDWTKHLLNAADFITSAKTINKAADATRAGIKTAQIGSQKSMPQEYYPVFNDQGIARMADERIRQLRQYKPQSSDAAINIAESLVRNDKIDAIQRERDLQLSNLVDKFNSNILALKQQYANQRTAIANENRQNWAAYDKMLNDVDASEAMQRGQNLKSLIYQLRTDYDTDRQMQQQADLADVQFQLEADFNTAIQNKFGQAWNNADKSKYTDINDFASKEYSVDYNKLLNDLRAQVSKYKSANPRFYNSILGWATRPRHTVHYENTPVEMSTIPSTTSIYFNRKGGKTRPIDEQHYLDQQKEIAKSLRNLNNNIYKLFQKMMS